MSELAKHRVLVVEDEALIALMTRPCFSSLVAKWPLRTP